MGVRIQYDAQTAIGGLTAETIDKLHEAKLSVARLRDALYAMQYPDTPQDIEAEVGVEVGKGQDFFSIWDGINTDLAGASFSRLNEIDQG